MNGQPEDDGPMTAQREADDRFVHGLLAFLHHDGRAAQEARVGRAMSEIVGSAGAPSEVAGRRRLVRWRAGALAAACVAVGALFAVIGLQGEQSAQALVDAAIRAGDTAGDRRYEIRVVLGRQPDNGGQTIGTLDVRDGQHVLIDARGPRGEQVTVGRTPKGEWAIGPDGRVEKFEAGRAWPRWVQFEDSDAMLVESLDVLMKELAGSYELKRSDGSAVSAEEEFAGEIPAGYAGGGDDVYRIIATKKDQDSTDGVVRGPEPVRVDLWIDRRTKVVERMELRWAPKHRESAEMGDGPRPGGPRPGPGPGPRGMGGPGREGAEREGPARDPRPGRGPRGPGGPDGPGGPAGSGGPAGPAGPGGDGVGQGPGPGSGPGPGPRGDRPFPPPPRPLPPPPFPPGGEEFGDEGGPAGDRRPPDRRGARFMDAPPRFGAEGQPPPPRLIVMQRIPAEKFPAEWFEAEMHNR